MAAKTSLIPKSKAKTAYGLLSEICALALEEPKRIMMADWLVTKSAGNYEPAQGFPACGTVGCVAGWAITLRPTRARTIHRDFGQYKEDEGERAGRLLGLSTDQCNALFTPDGLTESDDQQTPKHAQAVVAHVKAFQKRHRGQLLAKKV